MILLCIILFQALHIGDSGCGVCCVACTCTYFTQTCRLLLNDIPLSSNQVLTFTNQQKRTAK